MTDLLVTNNDLWLAISGKNSDGKGALLMLQDRVGLPNVASYALLKAKRKALAEIEDLEKTRLKLCIQFAIKDEANEPKLTPEGRYEIAEVEAFNAEWAKVLAEEVTLTGVRAVTLAELGDAKITPDELEGLGVFLVENSDA